MKKKKIELDVDFIGSQETLTHEEEKKLSDYFKKRPQNTGRQQLRVEKKHFCLPCRRQGLQPW